MSQDQKSEHNNSFQRKSQSFFKKGLVNQIDMKRHKCSMHHPNIENNLLYILNIEYDSDDNDDDDDDFDSKVLSIKSLKKLNGCGGN